MWPNFEHAKNKHGEDVIEFRRSMNSLKDIVGI